MQDVSVKSRTYSIPEASHSHIEHMSQIGDEVEPIHSQVQRDLKQQAQSSLVGSGTLSKDPLSITATHNWYKLKNRQRPTSDNSVQNQRIAESRYVISYGPTEDHEDSEYDSQYSYF